MHHRRSILILIPHLLLLHPSISEPDSFSDCSAATFFSCGNDNYSVSFPFGSPGRSPRCSYPSFQLTCGPLNTTLINISGADLYQVKRIDYDNRVLTVVNPYFVSQACPSVFGNSTLDYALVWYTTLDVNVTVYVNCEGLPSNFDLPEIKCLAGTSRRSYYSFEGEIMRELAAMCETAGIVPMNLTVVEGLKGRPNGFVAALQEGFEVTWAVGKDWCPGCVDSGGVCGYDPVHQDSWTCFCPNNTASTFGTCDGTSGKDNGKLIAIGVSVGAASLIIACVLFFFCLRCKKRRTSTSSNFLVVRNVSPDPSSLKDPEFGSMNYHTHLFSYEELQEATNGFDESRELGDGGFGTVYKGKLRDGRIVAVKRLYENNYKRVEQFMNEIEILSHLRHENLVTLYGCTSRHSRELLLVYEFVSNGTVADHLHGSRASLGALTWPVRLSIAIETACALAYLHAVKPQIIHRDVKTNNILLDDSFHVKVADFGLSRLFPVNASHVSTLPQGTPGYVDPEYHQCYQLTDKSDVYSFGVVLVELVSSKPAVDISRHRHEINLANMAINRIQSCKLEELIDPGLGHRMDKEIERMITMVAELAFRCLQGDKDMRPCIKEVLAELERIRGSSDNAGKGAAESDELTREESKLLKNLSPFSPDSVTVKWDSNLTTPNTSE